MVVLDDGAPWEGKLLLYPHVVNVAEDIAATIRAEPLPVTVEENEPLKLECQHFVACIAQGRDPMTNGDEGLRVMRVLAQASTMLDRSRGCQDNPGRTCAVEHPSHVGSDHARPHPL
jgi:UDP-2-acetamido-3-amino-2,3-dideoxy-glucuronate N-acetyltransferase